MKEAISFQSARRRKRAVGSRKPVTGPGWYRACYLTYMFVSKKKK
jgi:hypothetical protein